MKNKIKWFYHYIGGCSEVTSDEVINIIPDNIGRWQLRGKIEVKTKLLGNYESFGKTILVPIATIQFDKNVGYHCSFQTILDANLGYIKKLIRSDSPNKTMKLVEEEFNKLINIIKSL